MRHLITIILLFLFSSVAVAANYPLEIINIKPAGTVGSPVAFTYQNGTGSDINAVHPTIPTTNRIFRAYPGIEYNIRAAVIGGAYPYSFSLNNAPSGMTINSSTGEISWPNPQDSSANIQLTVTDSENSTISTTWSITVSTSGFWFVDSSYTGTSTGSISQPFKTLLEMLENTSTRTDIVYFRQGTYQLAPYGANDDGVEYLAWANLVDRLATNIWDNPYTWLGYPAETVNIEGWGAIIAGTVYFDRLVFSNFISGHAIRVASDQNYSTIRRSVFENLSAPTSENHNPGFFFTRNAGAGYYLTFQDNEFKNYAGAAIGSLYNTKKVLIENNYIHSPSPIDTEPTNIRQALATKYYNDRLTIRGNKVVVDNTGDYTAWGGSSNGGLVDTDNIEVYHNLFVQQSTSWESFAHRLNSEGYDSTRRQKTTHYYRNTTIGRFMIKASGADCNYTGPYYLNNNIIINPNTSSGGNWVTYNYISYDAGTDSSLRDCINDTGTEFYLPENSPLDGNYLLASGSPLLGAAGWQFADGSTPMDGVFTGGSNSQGKTPFSPSSRARFSPTSFAPYAP